MQLTNSKNYFKSDDVQSGDMIEILDAGEKTPSDKFKYKDGNPVINYRFKVKIVKTGDERMMNINKTSRNSLEAAYGSDTEGWIGKTAQVIKEMSRTLGKNIVYLEPAEDLGGKTVPF